MKSNSFLHLLTWLIEHTEITEDIEASAEELKTHYLTEENNVPELVLANQRLNSKIGSFLWIIYGTALIKQFERPVKYNVKYVSSKVRTVAISDGVDLIEC